MAPLLVVVAGLAGYLLGSLSPATLVARASGVDLRVLGSGNPGATNVGRALGRRYGVAVAVLDIAKGAVPAAGFGALEHEAGLVAGLAAVVGHISSPWLRGRGGKGVATAAGAVLGSHPLWAPVVLVVWCVVLAASRWVALASVVSVLGIPVTALLSDDAAVDVGWAVVLAVIVVSRHWSNFTRRWRESRHR